jgi:hypothetical protein
MTVKENKWLYLQKFDGVMPWNARMIIGIYVVRKAGRWFAEDCVE